MKVIVGLGNPGPRYRNTRHNVGFGVLDCLAARLGTAFSREKYRGLIATAVSGGEKLLLLKPLTFMNLSGECVARATRNNIDSLESLLVVVDDIHLPLGRIRLRPEGSAGGHNGLKSLIERLGAPAFPRLRLGVGQTGAGQALTHHVLGRFKPDEKAQVDEMIECAADAAQHFMAHGIEQAMNAFN